MKLAAIIIMGFIVFYFVVFHVLKYLCKLALYYHDKRQYRKNWPSPTAKFPIKPTFINKPKVK